MNASQGRSPSARGRLEIAPTGYVHRNSCSKTRKKPVPFGQCHQLKLCGLQKPSPWRQCHQLKRCGLQKPSPSGEGGPPLAAGRKRCPRGDKIVNRNRRTRRNGDTSSVTLRVTASPQGEAFWERLILKLMTLPLKGKARETHPKAFPFRGRWQPTGLTDEVVPHPNYTQNRMKRQ